MESLFLFFISQYEQKKCFLSFKCVRGQLKHKYINMYYNMTKNNIAALELLARLNINLSSQ